MPTPVRPSVSFIVRVSYLRAFAFALLGCAALYAGASAVSAGRKAVPPAPSALSGSTFTVTNGNDTGTGKSSITGTSNTITVNSPIVVTRTDDRNQTCAVGDCSLREAVKAAELAAGDDTITFDPTVFATPQTITFSPNTAGGFFVQNNSTVTINGAKKVTITGELGGTSGAFQVFKGSSLTLNDLTIDNIKNGRGIAIQGTVIINNSTISNNKIIGDGCGIWIVTDGTLVMNNSTVSGNCYQFYDPDATVADGGGIYNGGTATIRNSTIANNWALGVATSGYGGGIYNSPRGTLTLSNTIASNNWSGNEGARDVYNDGGTVISEGYNLVESSDAMTGDTTGNIIGQEAKLAPLADNGGGVKTHALMSNSPAIDAGKSFGATTDQRGFTRPVDLPNATYPNATNGDGSDIGAFEVQPPNTAPTASATPYPAVTNEDTPVQITLQGTDAEDNPLTFTITAQPAHGSLSIISTPDCTPVNICTATVIYTPAANYNGADSFKFKANDSTVDSNEFTESITVNPVPDLSISDVAKAEGNSGTTTFTFTVTLDSPAPAGGVTFTASTADNTATAGSDYVALNQPYTIPQGSTSTTVDVTVNGDTTQESNETFFVNITNVSANAQVADAKGQGTILNDDGAPSPGQIIISEFRLSGPGPAPSPQPADEANDEFVELYNATDSDFIVADSSPVNISGSGWALVSSDDITTPKYTIPAGTRIPARGHFLIANGGYSLSAYPSGNPVTNAAPDGFYYVDIPDGSGLALFRTTNPALFATPTERLDAVGFTPSPIFAEGTPLQPAGGITTHVEYSFVRKQTTGRPLDTDNNQNDFVLISTKGDAPNGVQSQLGAPGPENLTSPINLGGQIKSSLLDPAVSSSASPNRVRDTTTGTGPTAAGTLEIRRTYTNKTGADVTRLRFRVVDITSGTVPAGTADVRALTSATLSNVAITGFNGACPSNLCTVRGTTLEEPPAQAQGGGLNSTLSVGVVTLGTPLAPNASVNVRLLLGVATPGSFRFFVIVEALSAASTPTAQPAPATDFDNPKGSLTTRQKSLPGATKSAPTKNGQ